MSNETDYESVRGLLGPLDIEPASPSTVDVRRAMADGRRRVRMRRMTGVAAAAVVTVLAAAGAPLAWQGIAGPVDPPPFAAPSEPAASPTTAPAPAGPAPPTRCEVEPLPMPDGSYQSLLSGADPTGRYLVGRSYSTNGRPNMPSGTRVQPLIWDRGEFTEVDLPGADPTLSAVNSHGVAVGSSFGPDDRAVPFVYQDGVASPLDGEDLYAVAINEDDVIVGHNPIGDGPPVVWRSPSASAEELSIPGPSWSVRALGVDADGTVVGHGSDLDEAPDAIQQAFVWGPDGVRQELPMPTIDGQVAVGFRARSIHAGVVTGQAVEAMDGGGWRFHTVRYDLATGQFTDVSAASPVYPAVVSRHGWVVGGGADGLAMWPGEGQPLPMPMPDLLRADDELPGPRYDLVVLSDDGRLVAGQVYGYDDDPPLGDGGEPMMTAWAVVWHCD
jgi:hypothetical protein